MKRGKFYTRNLNSIISNYDMQNTIVNRFVIDNFLSNTYLIHSGKETEQGIGILVDPHYSKALDERLNGLGIKKILIVLTHEHFDHTTGVNWVKSHYSAELICQKYCAEKIAQVRNNRPLSIMSRLSDAQNYIHFPNYVCDAEIWFEDTFSYEWHDWMLNLKHTPGHTRGSLCFEFGEYIFTGDSLIPDEAVMTRFPSGSMEDYESITLPYLLQIEQGKIIMPGHGTPCKMSELTIGDDRIFHYTDSS